MSDLTPRSVALLINPAAARGTALRRLAPAVRRLRAGGVRVTVGCGADAADARRVAGELVAARPDALLALGGDGVAHLAVQAVAGTDLPLGLIPAGSGNDLAHAVGVPVDPVAAAEVVLAGRIRRIDAARTGGDWFLTVLTCGFAARVAERMNRDAGRSTGAYLRAVGAELSTFRAAPVTLELDGRRWRTEATLVAIANTPLFGGGMRICPDADPADGLLDVCVVGRASRAEFLRVFPRVYRGTHAGHRAVTLCRAATVSVAAPGDIGYADGERMSALPLTVRTVPGAVRLLVP